MKYITAFLLYAMLSCQVNNTIENQHDNLVRFGEALQNTREVKLSELVDKVELIPFETDNNCFMRDTWWFTQTPPYICASGHLFDYEGKHKYIIGKQGLGPCEDFYAPIDVLYHPLHHKFLSKVSKIIIYDENGDCTGLERQLFLTDNKEGRIISGSEKLKDEAIAGENFIFNNNYDSLLWIDIGLKDLKQIPFPVSGRVNGFLDERTRFCKIFTTNKDSTLFYNYWNDTIYRVTSFDIEPRWIIDLGNEKAPEEVRIRYKEILEEGFQAHLGIRRGGVASWDKLDAVRLTKDKKAIWAVYETSDYLIFIWSKISPYNHFRGITDFYMQVGYYNKQTGETVAVKGPGFIDDILGTGSYNPVYGVFNDNLMKVIWPFELSEFIEQKRAKGQKVHPRLLELHEKMTDEDNPFLMVAHLKKVEK